MPGDGASTDTRFGVLLRTLRERAGLTQQELAERADLTPHAVSSLERGTRTRPYPHTVRSLADALGASEDERVSLVAAVRRRRPPAQPSTRPADLVIPPTPLFGRDDDIAAVAELIRAGARLVALTGPGGVGNSSTDWSLLVRRREPGICPSGNAPCEPRSTGATVCSIRSSSGSSRCSVCSAAAPR